MRNLVKFALSAALIVAPTFAFAATDTEIRASIVQQLLSTFVVQVNALDKINGLVAQASDQAQFDIFKALIAQQLSETTGQLATLLNPSQQSQLPSYGGIINNTNNNVSTPSMPEVIKTLSIETSSYRNQNGVYYDVEVKYFEDGVQKDPKTQVTISADDQGQFNKTGSAARIESNTTTGVISKSGRDGKPVFWFQYMPRAKGTRTLTATVNGVSTTVTVPGQLEICDGMIDTPCAQ